MLDEFHQRAQRFLGAHEREFFVNREKPYDGIKPLTVMRHYGGPTRLLDWTRSAYVAAYFAVIDQPNQDAAIWWYDREVFQKCVDAAWAGHGMNRYGIDREVDLNETAFCENGPAWITEVSLIVPFARAEAQQGFFTAAGRLGLDHDALIATLLPDDSAAPYGKLVIPAKIKPDIERELAQMNVNAVTLQYPGADHVGASLTDESRDPRT